MQTEDQGRQLTPLGFITAVMIFFMPFSTVRIGGNGLLLYLGLPLIALSFILLVKNAKTIQIDNARLAILAFLGYYLFSIVWSPNCTTSRVYELFKVFLLALCLACNSYTKVDKIAATTAFIATGALICGVLLFKPYDMQGYFARRSIAILGVYQDPNYLCFLLFCLLAVCTLTGMQAKHLLLRLIGIAATLVILYCIIRTGSRSALVSGGLMVMLLVPQKGKKPIRVIIAGVAILLLILVLLPLLKQYLPETLMSRFRLSKGLDRSGSNRIRMWSQALQVSVSSIPGFLFGHGAGSSTYYLGVATHNHLMQILLENGLLGLLFYAAFVNEWLRTFSLFENRLSMAVFFASIVHSMTLSVQSIDYYWVTVAFCMTIASLDLPWISGEQEESEETGDLA